MEKRKIIIISSVTAVSLTGLYLLYKYVFKNQISNSQTTITNPDGSTVTISGNMSKPATSEDINNLKIALNRWKNNGIFTQKGVDNMIDKSKKLSRYYITRLIFLLNMAEVEEHKKAPYGLEQKHANELLSILNKIK